MPDIVLQPNKYIAVVSGVSLVVIFGAFLFVTKKQPIPNTLISQESSKPPVTKRDSQKQKKNVDSITSNKEHEASNSNKEDVLSQQTEAPFLTEESKEQLEAKSLRNQLFTQEQALDIDSINNLFENPSEFTLLQDEISNLYTSSEKAFENKVKYEELFLSVKEQNSSEVNLNRIECGEAKCLASIRINEMNKSVMDYVSNLRKSDRTPLNSLVVGQVDEELLMVFSTSQEQGAISLSKNRRK